jgi:hypothetical protein
MELRTTDGQLKAGAAFRLVATGYIIGGSVIFGPLFLLATLTIGVQRPAMLLGGLLQLLLLPVVLGIQSLLLGGVIVLGLWLYRKRRPILVVDGGDAPARGAGEPTDRTSD